MFMYLSRGPFLIYLNSASAQVHVVCVLTQNSPKIKYTGTSDLTLRNPRPETGHEWTLDFNHCARPQLYGLYGDSSEETGVNAIHPLSTVQYSTVVLCYAGLGRPYLPSAGLQYHFQGEMWCTSTQKYVR